MQKKTAAVAADDEATTRWVEAQHSGAPGAATAAAPKTGAAEASLSQRDEQPPNPLPQQQVPQEEGDHECDERLELRRREPAANRFTTRRVERGRAANTLAALAAAHQLTLTCTTCTAQGCAALVFVP